MEKMRKERIEIIDGTSVFDLQGSGENVLYYKQHPYAYEWSDNQGSIGKYLARGNAKIVIEDQLSQIIYYAGDKYILDGHHKAYAYKSLEAEPDILFIKKIDGITALTSARKEEALEHILP